MDVPLKKKKKRDQETKANQNTLKLYMTGTIFKRLEPGAWLGRSGRVWEGSEAGAGCGSSVCWGETGVSQEPDPCPRG